MSQTLEERIAEKEEWTFQDCLGLATEFNLKPRAIVAMVFEQGKSYVDGEGLPSQQATKGAPKTRT